MATIVNGKHLANVVVNNFYSEFISKISSINNNSNKSPHLVIYHLNDLKSSQIYIKEKIKFANKININVSTKKFDESANECDIIQSIQSENNDPNVSSVIVQLPITSKFRSTSTILNSVAPIKDIDALTTYNKEILLNGCLDLGFIPPTVYGVITLIASQQNISGNRIGVIGQGPTLGKPCSCVLGRLSNKVIDIDENTLNIDQLCSSCDILISASGKSNHIKSNFIKKYSGIIDGGAFDETNKSCYSSVCMDDASHIASWISPSPGGLGPLTVAWLFYNVYLSYLRQNGIITPSFEQTCDKIKKVFSKN